MLDEIANIKLEKKKKNLKLKNLIVFTIKNEIH